MSLEERVKAAEDPKTAGKVLDELARVKTVDAWDGVGIRQRVAMNSNTPAGTLDYLPKDGDRGIRAFVAGNRNTSSKTLAAMENSHEIR